MENAGLGSLKHLVCNLYIDYPLELVDVFVIKTIAYFGIDQRVIEIVQMYRGTIRLGIS